MSYQLCVCTIILVEELCGRSRRTAIDEYEQIFGQPASETAEGVPRKMKYQLHRRLCVDRSRRLFKEGTLMDSVVNEFIDAETLVQIMLIVQIETSHS